MNVLFVRVGADQSSGGGNWNGPVDSRTDEFCYVAIPESRTIHSGMERPYSQLKPFLAKFDVSFPEHLSGRQMHLDPDFEHLTYGDQGQRAKQLQERLSPGDLIVFYAGLSDVASRGLVYAIIGLMYVQRFVFASALNGSARDINAHSRRELKTGAEDIIVIAKPGVSGRLRKCLPIGEYRDRAYRVRKDLLSIWGDLSVRDGYLQRSARLPYVLEPDRFMNWLASKNIELLPANN